MRAPAPPPVRLSGLSSQPFKPAQQQAEAKVVQTQRALPKEPTPAIPRLPSPTPAQTHAALQLAQQAQKASGKPAPTYYRELANDPRQAQYIATLRHYAAEAQQHAARLVSHAAGSIGSNALGALKPQPVTLRSLVGAAGDQSNALFGASRQAAIDLGEANPRKLPGVGINVPGAGEINLSSIAAALANTHIAPKGIVGNVINEAIDLPAQTFLSSAIAGSALRSAIPKSVPLLGVSGDVRPIEGIGKSVLSQVEHPIRSFEEAPLSTALTFAGGEAAVGGALGKLARAGGLGDRAAELASTVRPDLKLYGESPAESPPTADGTRPAGAEGLRKQQTYNSDPLRKAAQVGYEKALTKLPQGLGRQADPFQAEGFRLQRNASGGGITRVGRVDRVRAAGEQTRRRFVKGTTEQIAQLRPKEGEHAVPLIAQGIVRTPETLVTDLQKEAAKLRGAQEGLTRSQLHTNKANLAHVEDLLANKKFLADPSEAFHAAARYRQLQAPLEAILIHGGVLKSDQVRAKLFPYAQAHMGAIHASPADHAGILAEARTRAGSASRIAIQSTKASTEADATLAKARAVEKIRNVIDLANRPGAAGEGDVAAQAVETLKRRHAIRDLREVPDVATAERAAADAKRLKAEAATAARTAQAVHVGVAAGDPRGGLRDRLGRPLTNAEIQAHMKANGVQDVGFISHKGGIDSGSSFYQATTKQPSLEKHARTGSAFSKGVADHSYEGLAGSIANQASRAAALEVRSRELNLLALKPKSGGFANQEAAQAYAKELQYTPEGARIEGGLGKLVPVHLGSDPILATGNVHPADIKGTLDQFGLGEHESAVSKSNGKYGLIPEHVQNRLKAHDEAVSAKTNIKRAAQTYQQGFRRAKLNTSTRHIAGVVQEQGIRLGMEGAGPQAKRTGKLFLRSLNKAAELDHHGHLLDDAGPLGGPLRELEGQLGTRGGQVASQKANNVVRKGQAWSGSDFGAAIARSADGAAHSTVGSAILKPWHAWQHVIEGGLSKVEESTHQAMLGKALKDSGFIKSYRSALKLQDEGMQALVKGGLTPNKADALAHSVDDMLGNWAHQTPFVRNVIGNYAPFGLWYLNSMRWLYRLPVSHPIKTGILAALYQATKAERGKKGQGFGAPGEVPAFLQGTIDTHLPVVGKVSIAPSYYSPGGTLGPEATSTAVEQFLPQLQGIVSAAKGQNALSGEKLTTSKGKELGPISDLGNILGEVATGPVPFATQAQSLLQGGGKPYGTANIFTDIASKLGGASQVKPGTGRPLDEQLVKLLSPIRFNFPAAGSRGGPSTPSGGGTPVSARQRLATRSRVRTTGGISARQRLALQLGRR